MREDSAYMHVHAATEADREKETKEGKDSRSPISFEGIPPSIGELTKTGYERIAVCDESAQWNRMECRD